jgi:malonyl-CoA O-methyltransferase
MSAKLRIRQSFAAASTTYDEAADLQKKAGRRLLAALGSINANQTVLDLGCGTGFVLQELVKIYQEHPHLIALDIAHPMLKTAMLKVNNESAISYICADAEHLPLQAQTVDVIISNLALQWCSDLTKVFNGISRVLTPSGRFCFTTFGPQTLHELKSAWRTVDGYPHVNEFYHHDVIRQALSKTGFQVLDISIAADVMYYRTVWELMSQLKRLGAQTVTTNQKTSLSGKSGVRRMASAYQQLERAGQVPATFETITVIASREK